MKNSSWCHTRAQAVVEFALVFPLFIALVFASVDLWLVALARIKLSHLCQALVRRMAQSDVPSAAEMKTAGENWIHSRGASIDVQCSLRSLPRLPSQNSLRRAKDVQLVQVELSQAYRPQFPLLQAAFLFKPLSLRAQAEEVRIYAQAR